MSAYDKLGLAMIPSGYKGEADENNAGGFLGKVYSVLPAQTTSDNLVTNGDFSDGTTDWLPHGDAATQISVVNGKLYVEAATAFDGAKQSLVLDNGSYYKLKADIELDTASRVRVYVSSGNLGLQEFTQDGSIEITFDGTSTSNTIVFDCGGVIGNFYIDNVSVVRITDGDFDFSRGSDATRVNSQGYIESVQVLSDELVQNGDFEEIGSELIDYSSITYGAGGWSLVNDKWVFDDVTSGFINTNSFNVLAGEVYKVVVDVSVPSGLANFRFTSGNSQTVLFDYKNFSDGVTTFYTKVSGVNGNIVRLYAPTSLSDSFTLNSISVQRVGQNWTFGTGWSIEDGVVSLNSPTGNLDQSLSTSSGSKYRVTFTISNYVSGDVRWRFTGTSNENGTLRSANGTYTEEITLTNNQSILRFPATGGVMDIDNISVVEITDDTDIPRLDYSDGCPTLLLEPQRINLVTHSQDIENFSSITTLTVTPNAGISPSGKNDAFKLTATNNAARIAQTLGAPNSLNVNDYVTGSIWLKNISQNEISFSFFDMQNSVIFGLEVTDQVRTDQWTRVSFTHQVTQATSLWQMQFARGGVDNGNEILVWNPQLEMGSYPTSDILTNGSTVTRNADVCNNAGDSTIFNDDEGVLYVEINKPTLNPDDYWLISVNDNTASNTVAIGWTNGGDELFARIIANGIVPVSYISGEFQKDTYYKIALKYKSGDSAVWVNGVEIHPDADTFTFSNSLKSINFDYGNGNNDFRGRVRSLLYFNEALTDEELEKLTSSTATQVLNNYSTLLTRVGATYESSGLETKLNELL